MNKRGRRRRARSSLVPACYCLRYIDQVRRLCVPCDCSGHNSLRARPIYARPFVSKAKLSRAPSRWKQKPKPDPVWDVSFCLPLSANRATETIAACTSTALLFPNCLFQPIDRYKISRKINFGLSAEYLLEFYRSTSRRHLRHVSLLYSPSPTRCLQVTP